MSILKVRVKNLKALKGEHEISPDGKSFVIVGDSAEGKTTILQVIASHLMQQDYPSNPLTDGADDGYTESEHLIEGVKYTISRKYKRTADGQVKLDRFSVVSETGGKYSLTAFLEKVLNGAFQNGKFDYAKYFFECKSPEARYKYLIDSIGGTAVTENNKKIAELEQERAYIGSQRNIQKTIWEQEGIFSADTAERDIDYYKNERTTTDATDKKNKALAQRKLASTFYNSYITVSQKYNEQELEIKELQLIADDIAELEKKIEEKKSLHAKLQEKITSHSVSIEDVERAKQEYDGVEQFNKEIESKANEEYESEMAQISLFNANRTNFLNTINSFRSWEKLDSEWNEIDGKIKGLKEENKMTFKAKLPIPELSIGDVAGKECVLYNGREFSFDNLSKGETIKVTAQIQRAINPTGDNFIIIPEAQSLGSKIDEIITECKNFNVQACVEYTERNEKFKMEFADSFIEEK